MTHSLNKSSPCKGINCRYRARSYDLFRMLYGVTLREGRRSWMRWHCVLYSALSRWFWWNKALRKVTDFSFKRLVQILSCYYDTVVFGLIASPKPDKRRRAPTIICYDIEASLNKNHPNLHDMHGLNIASSSLVISVWLNISDCTPQRLILSKKLSRKPPSSLDAKTVRKLLSTLKAFDTINCR